MTKRWIPAPELLAPAGNFEKLRFALRFGADAVYLAGKRFGMRAAADNFSDSLLAEAVQFAHSLGRKVYVTINIFPRDDDFFELEHYLETLSAIGPDGLIVADLGVFSLCRKLAPSIPLHISTQAATVNSYSCNQWYEMGAKRIVLARELSLREIEAIRRRIPDDLELEAFVHGSMCVSFSGRCMLSSYYTDRDANLGACTQPCRWQYRFYEEKRPEDVLTCEIHPEGSYIFGSKDLCMIAHIKDLIAAGINSFKIEGRMKSAYYTALVSNAYRIAIDRNREDIKLSELMKELEAVSHREFCTGYFFDREMQNSNFASHNGYIAEQSYLCSVESVDTNTGLAKCRQKNKFSIGDPCEYITPGQIGRSLSVIQMLDEDGREINSCPHPQMTFYLKTKETLKPGDLIRKAIL